MKLFKLRKTVALGAAATSGITMISGSTLAITGDDSSDVTGATVVTEGKDPVDNVVGFAEAVKGTAPVPLNDKNEITGNTVDGTLDPYQLSTKDLFCMTTYGGTKNMELTFDENLMRLEKPNPLRILLKAPKAEKIFVTELQATGGAAATAYTVLAEVKADSKYAGGYFASNFNTSVVYTLPKALPAELQNAVAAGDLKNAYILGGEVHAVGTPAANAITIDAALKARAGKLLGGTDRFATANNVAKTVFPDPSNYAIVNYNAAPDGAVAGGCIGAKGGAVLLAFVDRLPESTIETANTNATVVLFGGTALLSLQLENSLK